jgi:hypothetical protein
MMPMLLTQKLCAFRYLQRAAIWLIKGKESVIMRVAGTLPVFFMFFALVLCSCKASNQASASNPALWTTIPTTQGGIIEFGRVDGAMTLPAAMARVLSQVHQACGEKPSVGQVFRVRGTNSTGVFFTVINHAQGKRQMAGLVIAAQTGANQFEASLVSDSANSFGQTANPMLQQLFAAWHPGETPSPAGKSAASGTVSAATSASLHLVTSADNSASIRIPDGWMLDPRSGQGAMLVAGPNGERLGMEMSRPAVDPTNPFQVNMARQHYSFIAPGTVVYPFRGDLVKDFVNIFQAWRRAGGQAPARIQVETIAPMPTNQGNHCVHATGQIDPDGKGMQFFDDRMCAMDPIPSFGGYSVTLDHALLPKSVAGTEHALMMAIVGTYQPNVEVRKQQIAAQMRQKQQSDQQTRAWGQQAVNQINAIGQQATARMNATEAANNAQHAGYWAQQDSNARNSAGFSNYLLDQSVVQNNNVRGTGLVGHSTEWNSTANAMVQANPNKYEIVNTPNYWQGVDY